MKYNEKKDIRMKKKTEEKMITKKKMLIIIGAVLFIVVVIVGLIMNFPKRESRESAYELATTEEILLDLHDAYPMGLSAMTHKLDITDSSIIKSYIGTDSVDKIKEISVCETLENTTGYRMVLIKATDKSNAKLLSKEIEDGMALDQFEGIAMEQIKVKVSGKYVLLVMMSSGLINTDTQENTTVDDVVKKFVKIMRKY